jgi:DUF4097 and DUF4098 domain-containing protein YvlB
MRARNGDKRAFEGLYRRHVGRIDAVCLRLAGDPAQAEEFTQEAASAEIDVESVSGDVQVTGSAPGAHVEASGVSGAVNVSHVNGDLHVGSVSGNVEVAESRLQRAEMGATSGDLTYRAAIKKGGVYKFHSARGNVVLIFPDKPNAEFDVNTFSGDIRNDFGPELEDTGRYTPGSELHLTSGSGGAHVRAETLSGDVVLRVGG